MAKQNILLTNLHFWQSLSQKVVLNSDHSNNYSKVQCFVNRTIHDIHCSLSDENQLTKIFYIDRWEKIESVKLNNSVRKYNAQNVIFFFFPNWITQKADKKKQCLSYDYVMNPEECLFLLNSYFWIPTTLRENCWIWVWEGVRKKLCLNQIWELKYLSPSSLLLF